MGKMGEMEGNGGNGGKLGWGVGETAGIAHGMWIVEGCGGMWWRKMGQKIFTAPSFPVFQRSKIFPTIPLPKSAHGKDFVCSIAVAGVGGTPRSRSSACKQGDHCPTLTC